MKIRLLRHSFVASVLLWFAVGSLAQAANLMLVGNWTHNIGSSDLIAGAGTPLRSVIENDDAPVTVEINSTEGLSWTLRVRRSGAALPEGVTLSVRRVSSGYGSGTIAGGEAYLAVTDQGTVFFSGHGDRQGVAVQMRLDGLSISQGPGTFGTILTYEIE